MTEDAKLKEEWHRTLEDGDIEGHRAVSAKIVARDPNARRAKPAL